MRFNRLSVRALHGKNKHGFNVWECRCDCGNITYASTNSLKSNNTKSCGCLWREAIDNMSGENHYNWNHNLSTADRNRNRRDEGYNKWRNSVYLRDDFSCVVDGCANESVIEAHHLYGYLCYPEFRTYLPNGVTLCRYHHRASPESFHSMYTSSNNTGEQFYAWLNFVNMRL
jgi:hypothetical protein